MIQFGRLPWPSSRPQRPAPAELPQEQQAVDLAERPARLADRQAAQVGGQVCRFVSRQALQQEEPVGRPGRRIVCSPEPGPVPTSPASGPWRCWTQTRPRRPPRPPATSPRPGIEPRLRAPRCDDDRPWSTFRLLLPDHLVVELGNRSRCRYCREPAPGAIDSPSVLPGLVLAAASGGAADRSWIQPDRSRALVFATTIVPLAP